LPRFTETQDLESRAQECSRVAAILYVREIQAKFGITTTPGVPHVLKLQHLLSREQGEFMATYFQAVYPWILTIGGIGASSNPLRSWFVTAARELLQSVGIISWEGALNRSQLPWIKDVFEEATTTFGREVLAM